MPLLYRGAAANAASSFPPLNPLFWQRLAQAFSIDATNSASVRRIAYVLALLALIGAVALLRRDRIRGVVAIGMAVLPVAIGVAALHHLHHWYTVRYVITALPAYLLLAAIGASSLVPRRASAIIAMLVAAFIVHEGWSAATTEPYRKLNWRLIAATIHEHAQPNDLVLTTNDWSYVSLEFYLRRLPPRVRLRSAGESVARADAVLARNAPAWIVSAGFHRGGGIGDWSCRYPVVLASALESFRLHYAPGLRHLVMNRLTAADRRALVARYPTQLLHMTNADDFYLSGGWYGAEGTGADIARWTNGEPASVLLIGAPGDHRVTLRMLPHGGSQTVAFTLNGAPLAQFAMPDAWHEYALDVPRARWLDGANVLTLTFAHAIAPAALDPRSRDHRPLAAMVQEIVVTAPGAVRNEPLTDLTRALRINEAGGELLDGGDARPPVPASLLARIGIDPTRRVSAADAAAAVAYDSACLSDEDFLRVAYATLLGRALDRDGARYFLAALQKKDSRVMVARALVTSDEFRRARR
jgi:hypothetical protein